MIDEFNPDGQRSDPPRISRSPSVVISFASIGKLFNYLLRGGEVEDGQKERQKQERLQDLLTEDEDLSVKGSSPVIKTPSVFGQP